MGIEPRDIGGPGYLEPRPNLADFIESWWGEPLRPALVQSIWTAGAADLRSFGNDLLAAQGTLDLFGRAHPMAPGELRPVIAAARGTRGQQMVLRVLLYADSAITDAWNYTALFSEETYRKQPDRTNILHALEDLLTIRPLLDEGSLFISLNLESRGRHPSKQMFWRHLTSDDELEQLLEAALVGRGMSVQNEIVNIGATVTAVQHVLEGEGTLFARNEVEEYVVSSMLNHMRGGVDKRSDVIRSLAALNVPRLETDVPSLVSLRQSDLFGRWRSDLTHALSEVVALNSYATEANLRAGARIVHHELELATRDLEREITASHTLSQFRTRAVPFVVGVVSTGLAGVLAGSPTLGIVSGAASAALVPALEWFRSRGSERREAAEAMNIRDIVMRFGG